MITIVQAETIQEIHRRWGMEDFTPREVFPAKNNVDGAARRICRTLVRKKLLDRVEVNETITLFVEHVEENGQCYRYRLNQAALIAFDEWLQHRHEEGEK